MFDAPMLKSIYLYIFIENIVCVLVENSIVLLMSIKCNVFNVNADDRYESRCLSFIYFIAMKRVGRTFFQLNIYGKYL